MNNRALEFLVNLMKNIMLGLSAGRWQGRRCRVGRLATDDDTRNLFQWRILLDLLLRRLLNPLAKSWVDCFEDACSLC